MSLQGVTRKPLGHKAYGSIPHLPNSRLGPGDHHVTEGQARILTEKTRDRHDVVIVQEKLDGSNVAVANVSGQILALTRAGYLATTSPFEQHHLFAHWVRERELMFRDMLAPGWRVSGEWLAQAHGTRYDGLEDHSVFVAFDLFEGKERAPLSVFLTEVSPYVAVAPVIAYVSRAVPLQEALEHLGANGRFGALDPVEGVVYRCERDGKVDFLAKWVRPDKVDGCYLPEVSGREAVWNWRPGRKA